MAQYWFEPVYVESHEPFDPSYKINWYVGPSFDPQSDSAASTPPGAGDDVELLGQDIIGGGQAWNSVNDGILDSNEITVGTASYIAIAEAGAPFLLANGSGGQTRFVPQVGPATLTATSAYQCTVGAAGTLDATYADSVVVAGGFLSATTITNSDLGPDVAWGLTIGDTFFPFGASGATGGGTASATNIENTNGSSTSLIFMQADGNDTPGEVDTTNLYALSGGVWNIISGADQTLIVGNYETFSGSPQGLKDHLVIASGGTVIIENSDSFGATGDESTITVSGDGSLLNSLAPLNIGSGGSGTLSIISGGDVEAPAASLGGLSGGVGSATVSGSSSLWTLGGTLQIGGSGAGIVTVTGSGAILSAGTAILGASDDGTSSATSGTLTVMSGGVLRADTVINSGGTERIVGEPGGTHAVAGGSAIGATVISGGTLEVFEQPASKGQTGGAVSALINGGIAFEGSGGLLELGGATISGDTLSGAAVISGFGVGDTIDLTSVSFSSGGAVYLTSGNVLEIVDRGGTASLQLDPSDDFSSVSFRLSSDGGSGTTVTVQSGLSINLSYDSSVASAPSGYDGLFTMAMADVVSAFDADFTNPETINIAVGWGEENGLVVAGGGQSQDLASPYNYATISAALVNSAQSPVQNAADATLPASDPTSGGIFSTAAAEQQALGLIGNNSVELDGNVGFGTTDKWSYGLGATPSNEVDFIATAEHEITEVLGRRSEFSQPNTYSPMDLFRYAGPGDQDFTQASVALGDAADLTSGIGLYPAAYPTGYFSIDSGTTDLGTWNNYAPIGDLGDWYPVGAPTNNDPFNYVESLGPSTLSTNDFALMNVLGYNLANPLPTGSLSGTPYLNAEVTSGNVLTVSGGNIAAGTVVFSGGTMNVLPAGTGGDTIIFSGGTAIVSGGGFLIDKTIVAGGTLQLGTNAAGAGVTFNGGGTIQIEDPTAIPANLVISGFNQFDTIDLASVSFDVSGSVALSGTTATVSEGGHQYVLHFASALRDALTLSGDGGTGTDVAMSSVIVSAGSPYVVSAGDTVTLDVLSGGTAIVSAGGTAFDSIVENGGTLEVRNGGVVDPTAIFGTELISAGGTDEGAIIYGGTEIVYGVASGATLFAGSQIVESGGKASSTTVSSGGSLEILPGGSDTGLSLKSGGVLALGSGFTLTNYVVSNGISLTVSGRASNTTVDRGGTLLLVSGGSAVATRILSGGSEVISSGGVDLGAQISGGAQFDSGFAGTAKVSSGVQTIESGGIASGTIVEPRGLEVVESGGSDLAALMIGGTQTDYGIASGTKIVAGAQVVESGGTASGSVVSAGGTLEVVAGATVSGDTIKAGGIYEIASGATAFGGSVSGGTILEVGLGGTASGVTVDSANKLVVAGGTASSTIVSGGAIEIVSSGGIDSGTTVSKGGVEIVASGGAASSVVIRSGGTLSVLSGGVSDPTVINSGGTEIVSKGGTDDGALISGGTQLVYGLASGAVIVAGTQILESGGVASSAAVSGGAMVVSAHGVASGTVVSSGTLTVLSSGSAVSATLDGGNETISARGTDVGAQILSGSQLDFGLASGAEVFGGGSQAVKAGGTADVTFVFSGGAEIVSSSGIASNGTIQSGGTEIITAGGKNFAGQVASGGTEFDYGLTSGATNLGGTQIVESGGTASGTIVVSGGTDIISDHGTGLAGQLYGGTAEGLQIDRGLAVGVTVFGGGGEQVVSSGGIASASMLSGGGQAVDAGSTAIATVIFHAGTQDILNGTAIRTTVHGLQFVNNGMAISTTVSSGGTQAIGDAFNGGAASSTTILSGGSQIVGAFSGAGSATATTISGGTQLVGLNGGIGLASDTTILNGGIQKVGTGRGFATSTTVSSGGTQLVESGGSASGTIVKSEGTEVVESGGTQGAGTISAGGLEILSSGGSANVSVSGAGTIEFVGANANSPGGIVTFLSGAIGELSAGAVFSGFNGNFAFDHGQSLVILSGGTAMDGTFVSGGTGVVKFGGTAIGLAVGNGGKLIVSNGGADSGSTVSRGGAEIVSSGGAVSGAVVGSAGTEIVSSGGTANSTIVMSGGTEIISSGGADAGATISSGGRTIVGNGGTDVDIAIDSGGTGIVSAGGTILAGSGATIAIDGAVANAGTLLADSGGTLTVSGTVTNTKTIAALGTSATVVIASTISNSTGLILASDSTAQVELDNASILGGKLQTSDGALFAVSGTSNVISGGTLVSGSLVEVTSGSTVTLRGGAIGSGATVETLSGGSAIVSGALINSGTLLASGAGSLVELASGAVVNGGVVEIGDGVVDIVATGSARVDFLSGGSGGLEIADKAGATTAYSGKISGFGDPRHTDTAQYIELTDVTSGGGISFNYASGNAANTSGALNVSSGGTLVATIDMTGKYVTSDFNLAAGSGGSGIIITDPDGHHGGKVHSANIALFGGYIASFAPGGQGSLLITSAGQIEPIPLLVHPHG